MNINAIAASINAQPDIKSGTLRFWGEWFGRPYDNIHTVARCTAIEDTLVFEFEGGERLTVHCPEGVTISQELFCIKGATRVRWEWFYYGRPHLPGNRYFYDYVKSGSKIIGSTNVDWYKHAFVPSIENNAVEIL